MRLHPPPSAVFIGPGRPLTEPLEAWMRTHFAEPLNVAYMATVPEALAHLQSHPVDLMVVDETAAQAGLRPIHRASPTTAIIGLVMKTDESAQLLMLRQGVHEVLCLLPSGGAGHARILERALARVNGRAGLLKSDDPRPDLAAAPPRLIHDLNNLLTSINGFADLLLTQLPPDSPARMGAEHIRLAGRRAAALLTTHSPAAPVSSSPSTPATQAIAARAA